MATPRTGKPRGRPRKQVEESFVASRGRPRTIFKNDPDRFYVAFFEAHVVALGISDRDAAKIVAAHSIGNAVAVPADVIERTPAGMVACAWGPFSYHASDIYTNTVRGSSAATIAGRADTLRKKARSAKKQADPETQKWIANMSAALGVPLRLAGMPSDEISPDHVTRAKNFVAVLVAEVDEETFARDIIFPMIDIATNADDA